MNYDDDHHLGEDGLSEDRCPEHDWRLHREFDDVWDEDGCYFMPTGYAHCPVPGCSYEVTPQ